MRYKILFGWLFLAASPMGICQPPARDTASARPSDAKPADAKPSDANTKEASIELKPTVTKHTMSFNGPQLAYTATAAQIPIRNEAGEVECRMFYVAYTKDGTAPDQRPVTFAFNGGPG